MPQFFGEPLLVWIPFLAAGLRAMVQWSERRKPSPQAHESTAACKTVLLWENLDPSNFYVTPGATAARGASTQCFTTQELQLVSVGSHNQGTGGEHD